MRLSDLSDNERGIIFKVRGRGAFRRRILEMGFVKGKEVKVIKNAPLKDPIEYEIMGYQVSLRRSEASLIDVVTSRDANINISLSNGGVIPADFLKTSAAEKSKTINVAFVGNPNSGKTTIFNYSSKSRERVANYGGVTVDIKTATFKQGDYTFNVTDLPGTYSLSAYSPEELYVRDFITENTPDVVINIIDASNLERNLYLTTQLIDMDIKVPPSTRRKGEPHAIRRPGRHSVVARVASCKLRSFGPVGAGGVLIPQIACEANGAQ